MEKVEGLNTRGTWFYVKAIIPGDLTKLYGKTRVNVALKTTDRREAILRATLRTCSKFFMSVRSSWDDEELPKRHQSRTI